VRRHPYREPANVPDLSSDPAKDPCADDLALAAILGPLGAVVALSSDRATELGVGLILVAIALLVVAASRRGGAW
jgi:hypothetical protein